MVSWDWKLYVAGVLALTATMLAPIMLWSVVRA